MNEARITSEVSNLLKRLWVWPLKNPDVKGYETGRPDLFVLDSRAVIEVKAFTTKPDVNEGWARASFTFSEISQKQRAWLTMWGWDGDYRGRVQRAYLALGTRHGTAGAEKGPRMLWIIPWETWAEEIEMPLRNLGRVSLPLDYWAAQRPVAIREQGLNAMNLLRNYALDWHGSCWHLNLGNPLHDILPKIYWDQGERDLFAWGEQWKKLKEEAM